MVTTTLVAEKIDIGGRLVRNLDDAKIPVQAALWLYKPEPDVWHLVIASPLVNSVGPKAAYALIDNIVRDQLGDEDISITEISVVRPNDPLISALRKADKSGPDVAGMRITGTAIGNTYIENAYIYRVN